MDDDMFIKFFATDFDKNSISSKHNLSARLYVDRFCKNIDKEISQHDLINNCSYYCTANYLRNCRFSPNILNITSYVYI